MTAAEDWKLYLPPRGTLFSEKLCHMCGTHWWWSERQGGSRTGHDVYELIIARGPCGSCPEPEGERDGNSTDTDRLYNHRLAVEPDAKRVEGVEKRRGAAPMAMIHNLAHRIQESYGIRICVFCRTLTGNRSRPISFQLGRKYRHGRRPGTGESPTGSSE